MQILSIDSALKYYKVTLAYPLIEPNRRWWATIYSGLGASYVATNQSDSAMLYYKKAFKDFQSVNDYDNLALTAVALSVIYKNHGLYEEALENVLRAIRILEKEKTATIACVLL
ncbi:MAG: tetratricopeptide repeat protein [Bacteroidota bacterium]